jgi:hypothetical protein
MQISERNSYVKGINDAELHFSSNGIFCVGTCLVNYVNKILEFN